MNKFPAHTGWLWVKQGFSLFRKQPGGLMTLFLVYLFSMLAISAIPVLGEMLQVALLPMFSVAYMQACLNSEQKKRVLPNLLIVGFAKPAGPTLFRLGALYLLAAAIAIGASALVDGGTFLKLATGQIGAKQLQGADLNIGGAILLAFALYISSTMALCFAAPLIYWKEMALGKAIFFSLMSVLRALKAFIVFGLSWCAISVVGSQLILLILGRSNLAVMVIIPLSMIMTAVMHCSFYASYRQIFGVPGEPDAAEPPVATPLA